AEPEAGDRLERKENAVGNALAQDLVRLGRRRRNGHEVEALGDLALHAAPGAHLQAFEILDRLNWLARMDHSRAVSKDGQKLDALVLVELGEMRLVDAPQRLRHLLAITVDAGQL